MMPLAEVMNDHRMYLPFVGLALAVVWAARLAIFRRTTRITTPGKRLRGVCRRSRDGAVTSRRASFATSAAKICTLPVVVTVERSLPVSQIE